MNRRYRKVIIAGNWKMNHALADVRPFMDELRPGTVQASRRCDVVLCVPFLHISAAMRASKGMHVSVGAQNCHFEQQGAYTGEISCPMLAEAGCRYVIIGHSERRRDCGETDRTVNQKVLAACAAGLRPIVCVGESQEQRREGVTAELIRMQVRRAVLGLDAEQLRRVVFAYEPIWAIGTGETASPEQAEEVCAVIRACLREIFGAVAARGVSILYGGSMNGKNAAALLAQPDIDGGLIGGASLKASTFLEIIEAAKA